MLTNIIKVHKKMNIHCDAGVGTTNMVDKLTVNNN